MPPANTVRFPKLAAAVRKAIKRSGRSTNAIVREALPDAATTILAPTLRGTGRLHPDNRAAVEHALGLPATIWTLDGIPDGKGMGAARWRRRHNGSGPVGRALALVAAEPAAAPALRGAPEVHEVGVMFRDGRAHIRVNVMVPVADGVKIITMLHSLGIIPERSTEHERE